MTKPSKKQFLKMLQDPFDASVKKTIREMRAFLRPQKIKLLRLKYDRSLSRAAGIKLMKIDAELHFPPHPKQSLIHKMVTEQLSKMIANGYMMSDVEVDLDTGKICNPLHIAFYFFAP